MNKEDLKRDRLGELSDNSKKPKIANTNYKLSHINDNELSFEKENSFNIANTQESKSPEQKALDDLHNSFDSMNISSEETKSLELNENFDQSFVNKLVDIIPGSEEEFKDGIDESNSYQGDYNFDGYANYSVDESLNISSNSGASDIDGVELILGDQQFNDFNSSTVHPNINLLDQLKGSSLSCDDSYDIIPSVEFEEDVLNEVSSSENTDEQLDTTDSSIQSSAIKVTEEKLQNPDHQRENSNTFLKNLLDEDPIPKYFNDDSKATPIKTKIDRNKDISLDIFYEKFNDTAFSESSNINNSNIIFCGSDHNSLAFYDLVTQIHARGKNIKAVFFEEINSDQQSCNAAQNIIDRHFVANIEELEILQYALDNSQLNLDKIKLSMISEAINYFDNDIALNQEITTKINNFFDFTNLNGIKIGGIDHSDYRRRPVDGYDYKRHAYMNYHAANIIFNFIAKNPVLGVNDVILVSLGNSHEIDNFEKIPNNNIGIPSVSSILKSKMDESGYFYGVTSVSFVISSEIAKMHDKEGTSNSIFFSNKIPLYEGKEGNHYISKYIAVADSRAKLEGNVSNVVDAICSKALQKAQSII
ncbi:MAG: hypothetical protein ISQ32_06100 [Rickettsiales bacterium]|nr:hypothetical protein [Rickettsiales bacterium]